MLQCVAVCCSALQCAATTSMYMDDFLDSNDLKGYSTGQTFICVAVCCSVLQCGALCRSSITFLASCVLKCCGLSFSPPIHSSLSYSLSHSHSLFPLAFFVPQSFSLPDPVPFHFLPPLLIPSPTPSHRIPRQSRADARLLRGVAGKLESTQGFF